MAGEAQRTTSAWEELNAAELVGAGGINPTEGKSIQDCTTITAAEKLYELVEFELVVTGTPSADGVLVELIRKPNGNAAGQVPTVSYPHQHVNNFTLKSAANGSYYIYAEVLTDELDTYFLINRDSGALTLALNARTKTSVPAT